MKQVDTLPYIVEALKMCGGRAPTRQLKLIIPQLCPTEYSLTIGYDFRWGQQKLKEQGKIGIDKSVTPNEWYLK